MPTTLPCCARVVPDDVLAKASVLNCIDCKTRYAVADDYSLSSAPAPASSVAPTVPVSPAPLAPLAPRPPVSPPPSEPEEDPDDAIQERFDKFNTKHPEVYELFRKFARELKAAGWKRYSARAITHRIRWHYATNPERDGGFKINDHFDSRYARRMIREDPDFKDFFELRRLRTHAP